MHFGLVFFMANIKGAGKTDVWKKTTSKAEPAVSCIAIFLCCIKIICIKFLTDGHLYRFLEW